MPVQMPHLFGLDFPLFLGMTTTVHPVTILRRSCCLLLLRRQQLVVRPAIMLSLLLLQLLSVVTAPAVIKGVVVVVVVVVVDATPVPEVAGWRHHTAIAILLGVVRRLVDPGHGVKVHRESVGLDPLPAVHGEAGHGWHALAKLVLDRSGSTGLSIYVSQSQVTLSLRQ